MPNIHVFAGPTMPAPRIRAIAPAAAVHPPARHGSLLELDPGQDDVVVLLDGVFHGVAPIRHKEILWALDRGTRVIGASSMGALRAAELEPWGVEGVGSVFRWLRGGMVHGDDEVALLHSDASEGFRALSLPLVNLRATVARMRMRGELSRSDELLLVRAARGLYFGDRTSRSITSAARTIGVSGPVAARVGAVLRTGPVDIKARDAHLALRRAARAGGPPPLAARPPTTSFLAEWALEARGMPGWPGLRAVEVLRFSQVMAEDYAEFRRRATVAGLAGEALASALRDDQSGALARERLLVGRIRTAQPPFDDPTLRSWVTGPDVRSLADHDLVDRVVELARWQPSLSPVDVLIDALLHAPGRDVAARGADAALRFRYRLARETTFGQGRMTGQSIAPLLARVWGEDTPTQRRQRGLLPPEAVARWADLFGPHGLMARTPAFRLLPAPSGGC